MLHPLRPGSASGTKSPSDEPPSYDFSVSSSNASLSDLSRPTSPPISRMSTSNILRASNAPSKGAKGSKEGMDINRTPYVPSSELQSQIDSLSRNSPLSTTTSQGEYFDVLPSFQMFQSILKRDNSQFSENLSVDPPTYGDVENTSPTPPSLSPVNSHAGPSSGNASNTMLPSEYSLDAVMDSVADYNINDLESGEVEHRAYHSETQDTPNSNPNFATTHDTYGHTVLDNIDRLPKLHNSPLEIQIYVTKQVPHPHTAPELETRLKEYSSGDVVNGYIVITNNSDAPVDFGLFIVTLEGTVKATERVTGNDQDAGKIKKLLMKKFLKMYDLNASYGYAYIPNSAGIEYEAYSTDEHDGCVLGIPSVRILQPHTKYKKFFTFKFPEKLLDNVCMNSVLPHVLPPPSMGLDKTCFYGRGATISLNKALGYGYLNARGTPLLTKDYAFEDVSVSYTIEAKFIDKLNAKDQKNPLSHQDINDPNSEEDYVISSNSQYFLRYIPNLNKQLDYYNQDFHYGTDLFANIGIDGKLFQGYLNMNTWRSFNQLNYQIEREINSCLSKGEFTDDELKNQNLILKNSKKTTTELHNFNVKDQILDQLLHTHAKELDVDDNLYYHDYRMIGTTKSLPIYGKKKKKILSSLIKIGTLKMFLRVPSKVFPYSSPKLLMKYNNGSMSNPPTPNLTPSSSRRSSSLAPSRSIDAGLMLSPVSSNANIEQLYHHEKEDLIDHVHITLVFKAIDNATTPPKIDYVESNIVAWSYNTEYPLPIALGYDFFYCNPREEALHTSHDDVENTRENLQQLKDLAFDYLHFLKSNKTTISRDSVLYLESLKTLSVKKDVIKEYFATCTHTTHANLLNNEGDWKALQSRTTQRLLWTKELKIPLNAINKHNVTLLPSFQSCLVGRIYCLQVLVKYKGSGSDQKEFADNIVKVDVPILIG